MLASHHDNTGLIVHAVPHKAQQLPLSHTGKQCNLEQRFKLVALNGGQKGPDLLGVHRGDLPLDDAGQGAGVRRIRSEIANGDSLF